MTHFSASPTPPPLPDSMITSGETLYQIINILLPSLITAALSTKSLTSRWRSLHTTLLSLLSTSIEFESLSSSLQSHHPLLFPLLQQLHSTLVSLRSISIRCLSPDPPPDRLRLQSDLDSASSSLSVILKNLNILLRSGLLNQSNSNLSNENCCSDPSNAIVLAVPGPGASRAEVALFVRDASARLQIGGAELKRAAIQSLLDLVSSDPVKMSAVVVGEIEIVPALVRAILCDGENQIRDLAARAVAAIASGSDTGRRAVFDEGALGPLLRLLENGPISAREHAAKALESITADPTNAWAVSAYGGVAVLIDACRNGSPAVIRNLASGALRNIVSGSEDARITLTEGAVPVFVDMLASSNVTTAQRNAAFCLWILATSSGDEIKSSIISEGGLQKLVMSLRDESDLELVEYALKAIRAISELGTAARTLSVSMDFFRKLSELIEQGKSSSMQMEAAMVAADLAVSEESRKAMGGCMAALVRMLEISKPAGLQEAAASALAIALTVKVNRKELVRDDKSIARLVRMLDPTREEVGNKSCPVSVVLALSISGGARRRLMEAGACKHLQSLAEAQVPGAKKALQRLASGRLKNLFSMGWGEATKASVPQKLTTIDPWSFNARQSRS